MGARRKKAAHVFQKAYREKTSTTITPCCHALRFHARRTFANSLSYFFACLLRKKLSPC